MMKKFLMMVAFLGCALGAMTLASCGDDDDSSNGGGGGGGNTPSDITTDTVAVRWEASVGIILADSTNFPDSKDIFDVTITYPKEVGSADRITLTSAEQKTINGKSYITLKSNKFGILDSVTVSIKIKDSYIFEAPAKLGINHYYSGNAYNKAGQNTGIILVELVNGLSLSTEEKWNRYKTNLFSKWWEGDHTFYITTTTKGKLSITEKK